MVPRFKKQWEVEWNGISILVENWWDIILRSGERLVINGKTVEEYQKWLGLSKDIEYELDHDGETHKLRVHMGSIDYGLRVGCLILMDDEIIGGDTQKKFIN